jgi:hypothetical protein
MVNLSPTIHCRGGREKTFDEGGRTMAIILPTAVIVYSAKWDLSAAVHIWPCPHSIGGAGGVS